MRFSLVSSLPGRWLCLFGVLIFLLLSPMQTSAQSNISERLNLLEQSLLSSEQIIRDLQISSATLRVVSRKHLVELEGQKERLTEYERDLRSLSSELERSNRKAEELMDLSNSLRSRIENLLTEYEAYVMSSESQIESLISELEKAERYGRFSKAVMIGGGITIGILGIIVAVK